MWPRHRNRASRPDKRPIAMSRRRKKRQLIAEINVVPYIDVTLVLLIVFMVAAPLLMQGVEVELPTAPAAPIDVQRDEPLIVSLAADGQLYINLGADPKQSVARALLFDRVAKTLAQKPQIAVLIWADKKLPYGEVIETMVELQAAGATGVGLVTEPP